MASDALVRVRVRVRARARARVRVGVRVRVSGQWVDGKAGRCVGRSRLELGGRVAVGRARIKAALDVTYRYEVVHSRL